MKRLFILCALLTYAGQTAGISAEERVTSITIIVGDPNKPPVGAFNEQYGLEWVSELDQRTLEVRVKAPSGTLIKNAKVTDGEGLT